MRVAANPFCVWYDCGHMRTFKTAARAEAFAARVGGRIGVWDDKADDNGWWVERGATNGVITDAQHWKDVELSRKA